tara:strand:- start:107 stop:502 length:396 start_codon:yes stop_codon:yes gene_type:complete
MLKIEEYIQKIYYSVYRKLGSYDDPITKLTELSYDHQAIVWLYGKIETLTKLSESRKTKIKEQYEQIQRLNDKLTLRSLTLEGRTKDLKNKTEDLEELQSIYEDHKRFLKYMVVMSIFAGFMMGLVSYPLI